MNTSMKSLLAATCLLTLSCSGSSDSKKGEDAPGVTPAPAPAPAPTPSPAPQPAPLPVEPVNQGFRFVDTAESELPLYVRGGMNGWLGSDVSAEQLAAARLPYDARSGCYSGTLNLEQGEVTFRLAAYLRDAAGTGWEFLKVGLGAANTSTALGLGVETKVDVYYFPAGDANGKDLGGGGNFTVNFPKKGDYEFKFCTKVDDYTLSFLTVSAR